MSGLGLRMVSAGALCVSLMACSGGEAPAASAGEAAGKAPAIKLYALDCGRIEMLDLGVFDQGGAYEGRKNSAVDTCYLIRHPDGDLMWDAGLPDALNAYPEGLTQGVFTVSVPTTLASQIEALGLAPADIEYFSISHSHFDHVGNGNLFAGSTFLISEEERAYMFSAEARADAERYAAYAELESAEQTVFSGDYDVFGDGSVMILALPGHTPGHAALKVSLAKEGDVLLSGDLYHLAEAREKKTVPIFNTDAEETLRSMARFEEIAAETDARVIIQHEAADYAELPKPPAYLD